MCVCCSVEEALEYQATWAAFALQSKVRMGVSSHERCSTVVIDARFYRILGSLQLLLRVSRRFYMTT